MLKTKPRLIRMVSLSDILIGGILSWFIRKIFDFLWEKAKPRLELEGKTHIGRYLFVMFGAYLFNFMFGYMFYIPKDEEVVIEYQILVRRVLKLHRRYHQFVGNKPCSTCLLIVACKQHLDKYVSDPNQYPPFNF